MGNVDVNGEKGKEHALNDREQQFVIYLAFLSGMALTAIGIHHTFTQGLGCHTLLPVAGAALCNIAVILFRQTIRTREQAQWRIQRKNPGNSQGCS